MKPMGLARKGGGNKQQVLHFSLSLPPFLLPPLPICIQRFFLAWTQNLCYLRSRYFLWWCPDGIGLGAGVWDGQVSAREHDGGGFVCPLGVSAPL